MFFLCNHRTLQEIEVEKVLFDEDNNRLPFEDESVDLVTSSLSVHWVNNLPGLFKEVREDWDRHALRQVELRERFGQRGQNVKGHVRLVHRGVGRF